MERTLEDNRDGYLDVIGLVQHNGHDIEVRGQATRELTNVTLIYPSPSSPKLPIGMGRKVNSRFAAVETLNLIAGVFTGDLMDAAAPGWRDVLVDPVRPEAGAYGPRTHGSMDEVAMLLRKDPSTRQAVVAIWRATDLLRDGDKPCTLFLQFLIRDQRLQLHSSMRSQDVWFGVPYDIFMFSQLQLTMAEWLGVPAGTHYHHVMSLHLYDRDLPRLDDLTPPGGQPVTLPKGVIVPEQANGRINRPSLVAKDLLSPAPWYPCREANPWYAAQMERTYESLNLKQVVE